MDIQPGMMLNKRYRIERILGKGGMGAVYLAFDTSLGIEVAVKCNLSAADESTTQFLREAQLLANLRHPNLPRVIDYFVLEKNQFLVMDFIPGDDLGTLLEREGAQQLEKVLSWAEDLGSALIYLHRQTPPVIHRDIKPANLKLMTNGEVILVDFGIAKAVESHLATAVGATGYTPGFAPPEQYGTSRTGPYTDQFGMAATLYMLLTNQRPVDSVQRALGQAVLTPIRLLNPSLPQNVGNAIEKALEPRPENRFASVADFLQAIKEPGCGSSQSMDTVRAGSNNQLPPLPAKLPVEKAKKTPAWVFALVGTALLGLAGIALAAVMFLRIWSSPQAKVEDTQPPVAAIPAQPTTTPQISSILTATLPKPVATDTLPAPTATETVPPTVTLSPTPALRPVGDGKLIAFISDRAGGETMQVWTMRAAMDNSGTLTSTELIQLTTNDGNKQYPAWSPDGTRLLYAAPNPAAENDIDIWMIDLTNKSQPPQNLSNLKGKDSYPSWSSDGRTIAFTNKSRFTDIRMIYFVNPDGTNRRRVSLDYEEYAPIWSPNNEWLLYIIFARDHNYLFMRNKTADYATPQPYDPTTFFGRLGEVADPDWSPDGSRIAYTRIEGKTSHIYSLDFKSRGAETVLLTNDSRFNADPSWSPDAQWIAYTKFDNVAYDIWLMTATGLLPTNLTNDVYKDLQPAWQP